jgi:5-formyltetrahydrofolate cyclo-ligase
MDKQAKRQHYLTLRKQLSDEDQSEKSKAIVTSLEEFLADVKGVVALYQPINGEVDISHLSQFLWKKGITVALPKMSKDLTAMSFRKWEKGDALLAHPRFAMLEPFRSADEVVPNYVCVPCVAADANGVRLGYGKGMYDRALAVIDDLITLGCVYTQQLDEALPSEAHDYLLDYIVTETGILKKAATI